MSIAAALAELAPETRARLTAHHFDAERLARHAETVRRGALDNRVAGVVTPPHPGDLTDLPPPGSAERSALVAAGRAALARGECALVVLAGGMATRMGGRVKALVEAVPGRSFLDVRLAECERARRGSGPVPPLWLMTSAATEAPLRAALGPRLGGAVVDTFVQGLSLRLTPTGDLFRDAAGAPSEYAPGHGDLPDALRASGLLERFIARGGRTVTITNVDNLGATLDPLLIGAHLAHGQAVTCEVVDKLSGDRGGIPVRLDDRPVILEELRLPAGFDPTTVTVFNTNTFHVDARALFELDREWTWFAVHKRVSDRDAVQMERLLGEITSFLTTRFVRVPRTGTESRFVPVKDAAELDARRAELQALITAHEAAS